MSRILIKENREKFIEIAKDLKQFMPFLNEIKASFEALEIGEFTNEDFKKIVLIGYDYHIDILIKSINHRLDSLKISDLYIREKALIGSDKVIERFKESVDNLKSFSPKIFSANREKLPLKFISYEKGLFVLSKSDKEMILETFCRTYIENSEERTLYEVSQKLANAFNEYLEIFNETGIPSINKHYAGSHVLKYDEETNRMIIYAEGVKAVASYKKRKAELENTGAKSKVD